MAIEKAEAVDALEQQIVIPEVEDLQEWPCQVPLDILLETDCMPPGLGPFDCSSAFLSSPSAPGPEAIPAEPSQRKQTGPLTQAVVSCYNSSAPRCYRPEPSQESAADVHVLQGSPAPQKLSQPLAPNGSNLQLAAPNHRQHCLPEQASAAALRQHMKAAANAEHGTGCLNQESGSQLISLPPPPGSQTFQMPCQGHRESSFLPALMEPARTPSGPLGPPGDHADGHESLHELQKVQQQLAVGESIGESLQQALSQQISLMPPVVPMANTARQSTCPAAADLQMPACQMSRAQAANQKPLPLSGIDREHASSHARAGQSSSHDVGMNETQFSRPLVISLPSCITPFASAASRAGFFVPALQPASRQGSYSAASYQRASSYPTLPASVQHSQQALQQAQHSIAGPLRASQPALQPWQGQIQPGLPTQSSKRPQPSKASLGTASGAPSQAACQPERTQSIHLLRMDSQAMQSPFMSNACQGGQQSAAPAPSNLASMTASRDCLVQLPSRLPASQQEYGHSAASWPNCNGSPAAFNVQGSANIPREGPCDWSSMPRAASLHQVSICPDDYVASLFHSSCACLSASSINASAVHLIHGVEGIADCMKARQKLGGHAVMHLKWSRACSNFLSNACSFPLIYAQK